MPQTYHVVCLEKKRNAKEKLGRCDALFAIIYALHTRQSNMSPCWVVSFTVSCLIQWQKFDAMDNKICHYLFDIYTLKSFL